MQPLAYFAVRSLLGWLQFVERDERAFVGNAALLVATGAAHCWAVVYALFIAIHTRAMRFDGYHEGYAEHLPFWVSWTETLSIASMGVWWAAGFTTAFIRIVDDDAGSLPVETRDVQVNIFMRILRSPQLHNGLAFAHTVSCVGLFVSIILLCIAMALMAGSITACELCLCFVSVGFALPHAVVACRKLTFADTKTADDAIAPAQAAEAAAQEAAALGPQLCVILALADSPGHAYLWQNVIYLIAAVSFVAAVAACGRSPPKVGDAALPPEAGEFFTCLALDAAAAVSLVICFPHLGTWHLWALVALLAGLFVAIWFENWRDLAIELLDPLFVVRSDTDKALPGQQRQRLRRTSWILTLLCASVALWDIMLHPVQEGLFEPMEHDSLPDIWDAHKMLLLRWRPSAKVVGEQDLIAIAADGLGIEKDQLKTQTLLEKHRLWVFKAQKASDDNASPIHLRWKSATLAPKGKLATLIDSDFPSSLNVTLCLYAHAADSTDKEDNTDEKEATLPTIPADLVEIVGTAPDAQAAYMAGCDWWTETLDMTYGAGDHALNEDTADDHAVSAGTDDTAATDETVTVE